MKVRDKGFLEVKEAEANTQHKSIISAHRANAGNISKLTLWWVTAARLLKETSTQGSKCWMYKKERKTSSAPIM